MWPDANTDTHPKAAVHIIAKVKRRSEGVEWRRREYGTYVEGLWQA